MKISIHLGSNPDLSVAQGRHSRAVDHIGHSSVQPWSAGPIFPAVIARIERYNPERNVIADVCMQPGGCPGSFLCEGPSISYELTLDGRSEEYATRDDAEDVARYLISNPTARKAWKDRFVPQGDGSPLAGMAAVAEIELEMHGRTSHFE